MAQEQFTKELIHQKLKEYFGFSTFKGNQEAVILNLLSEIGRAHV